MNPAPPVTRISFPLSNLVHPLLFRNLVAILARALADFHQHFYMVQARAYSTLFILARALKQVFPKGEYCNIQNSGITDL
jgi:hypothetical protein